MTVATATCTTYNLVPQFKHQAPNYAYGMIILSARTLSDIVFLAKIPNRAVIVDIWFRGGTAETASTAKFGISNNGTETTFGTLTFSSTGTPVLLQPRTGIPFEVSISDTDAQAGATLYATISAGTWTTTVTLEFMCTYVHPGNINLT